MSRVRCFGYYVLAGVFRGEAAQAYGTDGMALEDVGYYPGYTGPGFDEWILVYNPSENEGGTGT